MRWVVSDRFDPRALPLADRHYNRQKVGSNQFVPPGSCLVLLTPNADALWVTSAPLAQYVLRAPSARGLLETGAIQTMRPFTALC